MAARARSSRAVAREEGSTGIEVSRSSNAGKIPYGYRSCCDKGLKERPWIDSSHFGAHQFVERNCRGVRDVEAGQGGPRREASEIVAALAHQAAQPAALGAEDDDDALSQIERGERRGRTLVEPAAPVSGLLQPVERARQIDDTDQGHAVERTRGGFGEHAPDRWRAVLGDDHRGGAESGG